MFVKKFKNCIIPFSLIFAMLISTPAYAEDGSDYDTNWGSGDNITIRSDGQDGYQTEHNTDITTNSSNNEEEYICLCS